MSTEFKHREEAIPLVYVDEEDPDRNILVLILRIQDKSRSTKFLKLN